MQISGCDERVDRPDAAQLGSSIAQIPATPSAGVETAENCQACSSDFRYFVAQPLVLWYFVWTG